MSVNSEKKEVAKIAEQSQVVDVAVEKLINFKKNITSIVKSIENFSEKEKEVDLIVSKWDPGRIIDIKNDDDRIFIDSYTRELRELRLKNENERENVVGLINPVVNNINSKYKIIKEKVIKVEEQVKPLSKKIKDEEEREKNERRAEKEKALHDKIAILTSLGAKLEDGYYVIRDYNNNPVVEIDTAEIQTRSDKNWEQLVELATQKKQELDKLNLEKEEAEKKRLKEIADQEAKNKKEAEDLKNERWEMRKERIEIYGFIFDGNNCKNVEHEITISIADLKDCDNDTFKLKIENIKNQIEVSKQKLKIEEIKNLFIEHNFRINEMTANYSDGESFKQSFDFSSLNIIDAKTFISDFKLKLKVHEDAKLALKERYEKRHDILSTLGFSLFNVVDVFRKPYLMTAKGYYEIYKKDVIEIEDDEFNNILSKVNTAFEKDRLEKETFDKDEVIRIEKENAAKQTDSQNIENFKSDVKLAAAKFTLSNDEKVKSFNQKLNNFLNSL